MNTAAKGNLKSLQILRAMAAIGAQLGMLR